eukprot:5158655-Pyramimonas_sp.AAC.1
MGIGSGTLPGDSIACLWFLGPYHWSVDGIVSPECPGLSVSIPWLKHCLADDVSDRVRLCSWSQQPIEISLTSFADDLARTQLVRSLEGLIRLNNTNTEHLKDRLSIVNVQANSGKQESLVYLGGKGAQAARRRLFGGRYIAESGIWRLRSGEVIAGKVARSC